MRAVAPEERMKQATTALCARIVTLVLHAAVETRSAEGHIASAAYWGGTAFNWLRGPAACITPERPARFRFSQYADSARRFLDVTARVTRHLTVAQQCAQAGLSSSPQ
jgi:hypothetical protein